MTVRFNDEALAEYIAAGQYYNRQVPGLGNEFAGKTQLNAAGENQSATQRRLTADC